MQMDVEFCGNKPTVSDTDRPAKQTLLPNGQLKGSTGEDELLLNIETKLGGDLPRLQQLYNSGPVT